MSNTTNSAAAEQYLQGLLSALPMFNGRGSNDSAFPFMFSMGPDGQMYAQSSPPPPPPTTTAAASPPPAASSRAASSSSPPSVFTNYAMKKPSMPTTTSSFMPMPTPTGDGSSRPAVKRPRVESKTPAQPTSSPSSCWVDIQDDKTNKVTILTAQLCGFRSQDVDVKYQRQHDVNNCWNWMLTATPPKFEDVADKVPIRIEIPSLKAVSRTVTLNYTADVERAPCMTFENGLMKIEIPYSTPEVFPVLQLFPKARQYCSPAACPPSLSSTPAPETESNL